MERRRPSKKRRGDHPDPERDATGERDVVSVRELNRFSDPKILIEFFVSSFYKS